MLLPTQRVMHGEVVEQGCGCGRGRGSRLLRMICLVTFELLEFIELVELTD